MGAGARAARVARGHARRRRGGAGRRTELLFIRVPKVKTLKNRVHVDLQPDTTPNDEVDRLTRLGARLIDDQRRPDGTGWVVLADPAGNEFCVERSAAERA
ncbi:MAG TPA: VOC family protein [Actinoplanes sp.]|nr:VOC family protein [Actinoplanes sp.]